MKECRFLALPYWPSFWNPKLHPSIFVSRQWFCHMPKLLHVAELWWLWGPWRVQWTHLHVQENVLKWTQLSDAVCFPAGGHDTRGGFGITVMLSWHLSAKNAPNNIRPPAAAGWMDLLWILTLPCWRKEIDLSDKATFSSPLLSSSVWSPVSIRQEGYLIYCCLPVMQNLCLDVFLWFLTSTRHFGPKNCCSLDIFTFLGPFSVKSRNGWVKKCRQISSFWNCQTSLSGSDNHGGLKVNYITFLSHSDA